MLVNLLLQSSWQEVVSWMRNLRDAREDPSGLGPYKAKKIFIGEPKSPGDLLVVRSEK